MHIHAKTRHPNGVLSKLSWRIAETSYLCHPNICCPSSLPPKHLATWQILEWLQWEGLCLVEPDTLDPRPKIHRHWYGESEHSPDTLALAILLLQTTNRKWSVACWIISFAISANLHYHSAITNKPLSNAISHTFIPAVANISTNWFICDSCLTKFYYMWQCDHLITLLYMMCHAFIQLSKALLSVFYDLINCSCLFLVVYYM